MHICMGMDMGMHTRARDILEQPNAWRLGWHMHMHLHMHLHMHMHMHMHITHTPRLQDFDLEWLEAKIAGKR